MDDRVVLGDTWRMGLYDLSVLSKGNLFYRRSILCRCPFDGTFDELWRNGFNDRRLIHSLNRLVQRLRLMLHKRRR